MQHHSANNHNHKTALWLYVSLAHSLFKLFHNTWAFISCLFLSSVENFPPMLGGSEVFLVTLRQESVYFFNATDEGDNFTVTISGDQPVNSSLENNGSLYTFTWTLQELDNTSVSFLAMDSFGAVSMLDPQVQICVCENGGTCTLNGLSSITSDPLILNCECQQGKQLEL